MRIKIMVQREEKCFRVAGEEKIENHDGSNDPKEQDRQGQ